MEDERHDPEDVQEESLDDALPHHTRPRKAIVRTVIALLVLSNVLLTIAGYTIRPKLLAERSEWLLVIDPRTIHMLATAAAVSTVAFFSISIIRRVVFDPLYFFMGRWYGESAIRWVARKSPDLAPVIAAVERWFPRWGRLILAVYPHAFILVLAGSSRMKFRTFFAFDFLGVVIASVVIYFLAPQVETQVEATTGFIQRFIWPLTILSVLLGAYYFLGGRGPDRMSDVERELEGNADKKDS